MSHALTTPAQFDTKRLELNQMLASSTTRLEEAQRNATRALDLGYADRFANHMHDVRELRLTIIRLTNRIAELSPR